MHFKVGERSILQLAQSRNERVAIANCCSHSEAGNSADSKPSNEEELRHDSRRIDVFPFQILVMLG